MLPWHTWPKCLSKKNCQCNCSQNKKNIPVKENSRKPRLRIHSVTMVIMSATCSVAAFLAKILAIALMNQLPWLLRNDTFPGEETRGIVFNVIAEQLWKAESNCHKRPQTFSNLRNTVSPNTTQSVDRSWSALLAADDRTLTRKTVAKLFRLVTMLIAVFSQEGLAKNVENSLTTKTWSPQGSYQLECDVTMFRTNLDKRIYV